MSLRQLRCQEDRQGFSGKNDRAWQAFFNGHLQLFFSRVWCFNIVQPKQFSGAVFEQLPHPLALRVDNYWGLVRGNGHHWLRVAGQKRLMKRDFFLVIFLIRDFWNFGRPNI